MSAFPDERRSGGAEESLGLVALDGRRCRAAELAPAARPKLRLIHGGAAVASVQRPHEAAASVRAPVGPPPGRGRRASREAPAFTLERFLTRARLVLASPRAGEPAPVVPLRRPQGAGSSGPRSCTLSGSGR